MGYVKLFAQEKYLQNMYVPFALLVSWELDCMPITSVWLLSTNETEIANFIDNIAGKQVGGTFIMEKEDQLLINI